MSRNRYIIDLADEDATNLRARAKEQKLKVTAFVKRVLLLELDRLVPKDQRAQPEPVVEGK